MATSRAQSKTAAFFRARMADLMRQRELTQMELAELAGTSHSGISRILSGEEAVTLDRGERIAGALGVALSQMLPEKRA